MRRASMLYSYRPLGLAVVVFASSGPVSADLLVSISGAKEKTGTVIASLFSSAEDFLENPVMERRKAVGASNAVEISFGRPEAGIYAISVVYDEDNNGKLNTGFFGIPTEKIGFSNGATSRFGPPSFDEASFRFSGEASIDIHLGEAGD